MRVLPTKGFIGGLIVGHLITNILYLWTDGGYDRMQGAIEYYKAHPEEPLDPQRIFTYILEGGKESYAQKTDESINNSTDLWFQRIQRARSMGYEGYSSAEIAEHMDLPEDQIIEWLEAEVD